ncbi:hypothetical protein CRG98_008558 [Punica granatum]|uniref:Uncharacterized protein n=1 Tax=Punica granatum TaxID=22663 RepID=A0A2I0KR87_PUNGR|nr:hypothetical protein CRG98_008558 [Punica granatum]
MLLPRGALCGIAAAHCDRETPLSDQRRASARSLGQVSEDARWRLFRAPKTAARYSLTFQGRANKRYRAVYWFGLKRMRHYFKGKGRLFDNVKFCSPGRKLKALEIRQN